MPAPFDPAPVSPRKISKLFVHSGQAAVLNAKHRFKVVVAGRRWGKCLYDGSMISMADGGERAIETLKPGDMVLTVNEDTYEVEPRPVVALQCNGERELLELKTAGRTVRCTPNHPWLVNNRWVDARDVRSGDLIAVPKRLVFGAERLPDHEVELLAIWLAEGCNYQISNGNESVLNVARSAVQKLDPELTMERAGRYDWNITNGLGPGKRNGLHNRNAFKLMLERYGVWGRDSKTKFIPEAIFKAPEDQVARFLNLFMACDGCITRRSEATYGLEVGLANESMLRQLAKLFHKFGIRGSIYHKVHKGLNKHGQPYESWRWVTAEPESLVRFAKSIGAVGKEEAVECARLAAAMSRGNSNVYLPIAHDDFVDHLIYEGEVLGKFGGYNARVARGLPRTLREGLKSWRKQTATRVSRRRYEALREFSDGFFDPIADGDVAWEEVKSVEAAGVGRTWDVEIEDNHNFIAEGMVSHNSQVSKVSIIRAAQKRKSLIWYVAPTYRMAKTIMYQELIEAIPQKWIAKANETTLEIRLKNGTRIELKGADKPDTLRGVGLDFLVIDEAQDIRRDTWTKVLRPTLSSTNGKALIIGTPKGFNWLYDVFMLGQRGDIYRDKKGRRVRNTWKSWQFRTADSPFIPPAEVEAAKSDMDEKSFNQEYLASFETMSGRVYHCFDRTVHVGNFKFNPKLPIWVGMDFNVDPMSAVILQPQPDGSVWAVDEIVLPSSNTEEMAEELERRLWRMVKRLTIYPDPAGAARGHARGESDLQVLREKGFRRLKFRRKHPRVSDRVNAVNRMLRTADGQVRFYVDHKCRNLIGSLEQTLYKPNSREIDKSLGVEHITDALGYCIEIEFPTRKFQPVGISI